MRILKIEEKAILSTPTIRNILRTLNSSIPVKVTTKKYAVFQRRPGWALFRTVVVP
jgi:hypothetical protein